MDHFWTPLGPPLELILDPVWTPAGPPRRARKCGFCSRSLTGSTILEVGGCLKVKILIISLVLCVKVRSAIFDRNLKILDLNLVAEGHPEGYLGSLMDPCRAPGQKKLLYVKGFSANCRKRFQDETSPLGTHSKNLSKRIEEMCVWNRGAHQELQK